MKILIIGSKGFIGIHCRDYFSQRHESWGCDVVHDYVDEKYFTISASNSDYTEIFQTIDFDICINCSGAANVSDSLTHPLRDYELNTANVFKMLDAIRRYSPECKFINLSSAAVYGNPKTLPIKEDQALQPVSPYGMHKLQAEQVCEEFFRFYQIPTCSLRIFSAYGAGLQKQLFWDLYKKTMGKNTIELFGTGKESRDFIHVNDIVNAICCIIENAVFNAEVINIANGNELHIKDVVPLFFEKLKWPGEYIFTGENRKGDPINWCADISKIQEMGYIASYTIEKGLDDYISWLNVNK